MRGGSGPGAPNINRSNQHGGAYEGLGFTANPAPQSANWIEAHERLQSCQREHSPRVGGACPMDPLSSNRNP
jgi:hypothetical protein